MSQQFLYRRLKALLLAMFTGAAMLLNAQETHILFVLDASFSMKKHWNNSSKWETAVNTIVHITDSINKLPNVKCGLRAFGQLYDESEHNCKDTRLEIPIGRNDGERLLTKLKTIKPKGITPIAFAMEKAAGDFGTDAARNILILITDGEEACDGDMCAVSAALQQKHIVLKPFVIGLQLNPKAEAAFNCFGEFVNVNTEGEFDAQLQRMVHEAIAKTTIQINLTDAAGKPVETGMPISFSDHRTGVVKYRYFHTMNALGNPDTITISPLFDYDITVHTIPELRIDNVHLKKNEHNVVSAVATQGNLRVWLPDATKNQNAQVVTVLVHRRNDAAILLKTEINRSCRLLTGSYDVEVLTTPAVVVRAVEISPQKNTEIEIPLAGSLQLQKSADFIGSVFRESPSGLERIVDLEAGTKPQQWWLQPGNYRMVARPRTSRAIHSSVEKEFTIAAGGSVSLKL